MLNSLFLILGKKFISNTLLYKPEKLLCYAPGTNVIMLVRTAYFWINHLKVSMQKGDEVVRKTSISVGTAMQPK